MKAREVSLKSGPDGERVIGVAMRWFVISSCTTIAIGVLLLPCFLPCFIPMIGSYQGFPSTLAQVCGSNIGRADPSMANVLNALASLNPLAFIEVGVLLLLATPFFRVAAGAVMFASRRDRTYVAISAFILVVLMFASFVVGPIEAGW